MTINDTIRLYSLPYEKPTADARFIGLALSEIQAELQKLAKSLSIPEIRIPEIDFSGIREAIEELKSGFPGPVPPVDIDLNPVRESYEQTAQAIKELLGEVKATNQRVASIRGGGGPSIIGINDASGNRLKINEDGSLTTVIGESDALTNTELRASPVQVATGLTPLTNTELRSTAVPISGTIGVSNFPAMQPVSGAISVTNLPATQPVTLPTRTYKALSSTAIVNAGAGYTTVLSFTPSVPITLCGYNGGYEVIVASAALFKVRFNVASTIRHSATFSSADPAWIPLQYTIAAGELVTITITHDQIADTTFRATINYYEGT